MSQMRVRTRVLNASFGVTLTVLRRTAVLRRLGHMRCRTLWNCGVWWGWVFQC